MDKIRVAYDYQIFGRQRYGGISKYISRIAEVIATNQNFDIKILAGAYINEYLRILPSNLTVGFAIPKISKTGKVVEKGNTIFSKLWLQRHPVAIVHETFYAPQSIVPRSSRKVLTVHDMIDERYSQNSDIIRYKEIAIRRADHIICVSENTKIDLLNLISINPDKVSVIYHGYSVTNDLLPSEELIQPIDAPYILYVGDRYGYKNFWGLLQAYANSKHLKKNFKLVCFGSLPLSSGELMRAHEIGISGNCLLYFSGSDALLKRFYQGASAFVYPSMYEGFGIPLLEAMSASCPVVCSNTSSIPEVVGDAAEFFDPYDSDSIICALEKVLFSSEHASSLVQLGLKRIHNFSWQTCAEQTSLVYSSLV